MSKDFVFTILRTSVIDIEFKSHEQANKHH